MMHYFIWFVSLVALAWLLVYGIRYWTERLQIMDVPNDRSSHSRPVPRGGGAAIAAICIVGSGFLWWRQPTAAPAMAGFVIGALLVTIISVIDDVRQLSSITRLFAHIAAAVLLIIGCGYPREIALPLAGNVPLFLALGLPLALVWIVGLTNAYNFMDGIDGIAACQAIIAGLGWFLLGEIDGQWTTSALALLVVAGSAGFLIHNWSPAKIFMGDVGSAFLGYTFAFLTLNAGRENPRMYVAGLLLVWPFVFDSAFTFLRRLMNRENVFAAHRSHLYQRLIIAGWSHAATTLLYASLDLIGVVLALLFVKGQAATDWLVMLAFPVLACGLWLLVLQQEGKHCTAPAVDSES